MVSRLYINIVINNIIMMMETNVGLFIDSNTMDSSSSVEIGGDRIVLSSR